MRLLPLLALLIAVSVHAQAPFELTDPLLLIDGQRTEVVGAPLISAALETLEMEIPGLGLLMVSDTPFDGARRAGDFDRTRLVLVVDGRSIRLRSETSLLGVSAPVPAYARLDRNPNTPSEGPVTLRLMDAPEGIASPTRPPAPPPVSASNDELVRQLEVVRAERDRLRDALAHAELERDEAYLRLNALREEATRLRTRLAEIGAPIPQAPLSPPSDPAARISLPDFDTSRLRNRDQIEAQLRSATYPEWADASDIGGDVLVLFLTDINGTVIRTAVPRPIGGGLDALAEEIVQGMRFIPARADGLATRLRSQVVVRFRP